MTEKERNLLYSVVSLILPENHQVTAVSFYIRQFINGIFPIRINNTTYVSVPIKNALR